MTLKNKSEPLIQEACHLMPKGKDAEAILKKRAVLLSTLPISERKAGELSHYICFRLGVNDQYGIPYQYASEIISHANVTAVPFAPSFIAGVINHRGALISVLDLKNFFYNQTTVHGTDTQIIFVKANNMTVGILADSVVGSDYYESSTLMPSLAGHGLLKPKFIIGLHHGVIAIINVEAILSDKSLQLKKNHTLTNQYIGDTHA